MTEPINEKVSVVTVYNARNQKVLIQKLQWKDKIYTITQLGFHHTVRVGRVLHHLYSVTDGNLCFKLNLATDTLSWILEEISDGMPG